jgi:RNA polymerase-interacting CarD/CdnL/TRCF family regulator
MTFQIGQRVVYPAFGLGRLAGLARKSLLDAELTDFYEVIGEHSTLWVPVSEAAARGLRRLTRQDELPLYRSLLRMAPAQLSADVGFRFRDSQQRIKRGTLQALCEIVRDLSAYGWRKPLDEYDVLTLKKSRHWLCQEWAAADGVSLSQAAAEIDSLLLAGRQELQA